LGSCAPSQTYHSQRLSEFDSSEIVCASRRRMGFRFQPLPVD
jgi:hypothetical protein